MSTGLLELPSEICVVERETAPALRPRRFHSTAQRKRRAHPPARRFHGPDGPPPAEEGSGGRGHPWEGPTHLEWPFWVLMLLPWITLAVAWILGVLNTCLFCLPLDVPIS